MALASSAKHSRIMMQYTHATSSSCMSRAPPFAMDTERPAKDATGVFSHKRGREPLLCGRARRQRRRSWPRATCAA